MNSKNNSVSRHQETQYNLNEELSFLRIEKFNDLKIKIYPNKHTTTDSVLRLLSNALRLRREGDIILVQNLSILDTK